MENGALPVEFKEALMTMGEKDMVNKITRTGMEISEQKIKVKYNIPLRNHSAQMTLTHDKASGNITVQGFLMGQARNRWGDAAYIANLLDKANQLPLYSPIHLSPLEVNFDWFAQNPKSINLVLEVFDDFCTQSLGESSFTRYSSEYANNIVIQHCALSIIKTMITLLPQVHSIVDQQIMSTARQAVADEDSHSLNVFPFLVKMLILNRTPPLVNVEKLIASLTESAIQNKSNENPSHFINFGSGVLFLYTAMVENNLLISPKIEELIISLLENAENNHFYRNPMGGLFCALESIIWVLTDKKRPIPTKVSDVASVWAGEGAQSYSSSYRDSSIHVFELLFKHNLGFDKAVEAAEYMLKSDYYGDAEKLFKMLIAKEQGYSHAARAAALGIESSSYFQNRYAALRLFEALFEKKVGYDEAITAATNMGKKLQNDNDTPFDLFDKLIKVGKGIPEAVSFTELCILDPNEKSYKLRGFMLLKQLAEKLSGNESGLEEVERRKLIHQIASIATSVIQSKQDSFQRKTCLQTFQKLIKNEQLSNDKLLFDQASAAAEQGIKDPYTSPRESALSLFSILVEKGYDKENSFVKAVAAAGKCIIEIDNDDDSWIPLEIYPKSLKLFRKLFTHGFGFAEAASEAKSLLLNTDPIAQEHSLEIFKELFAFNKGLEEAALAAEEGLRSSEDSIRKSAAALKAQIN